MSTFSQYHDSFDPETLALLEIVFNETWMALQSNGNIFDQDTTRTAIADLVVKFCVAGRAQSPAA
jgi:hypothetical protein